MRAMWWRKSFWFLLAALLGTNASVRAQATDPNAGSDVVGRIVPPTRAMAFVGIPPADQTAMKAAVDRLWAIVLRNPALNPPKGFDLEQDFIANGILPGPREPYMGKATGLFYWYRFQPGINRVQKLPVAMHAFYVTANLQSLVFVDRWQEDGDGQMYFEPREIRRVGGYPQYSNGVVVLANPGRPLWTPAARDRVLRRDLAAARDALQTIDRTAAANDPAARLASWLSERPARQREADKLYEDTKRSNPQLAEKIRANSVMAEQTAEKALRQAAEASSSPAAQARSAAQRQKAEECVKYLEGELARLSQAELAAPAYVSLSARQPVPKSSCSRVVDKSYPDAVGIVAANPGFFDTSLPRTAIQVVMVDFSNFEKGNGPRLAAYESLRDGMDYKALAATLAKPPK